MLQKRGKKYYCRVFVPLELQERLGRKELKKSLQTARLQEAKTAARKIEAIAETTFFRMRAGMLTERELEQLSVSILSEFSGQIEKIRRDRGSPLSLMSSFPLDSGDAELIYKAFKFPRTASDIQHVVVNFQSRIDRLLEQRATGLYDLWLRTHASRIVDENKLNVEQPPPEWFHPDEVQWLKAPPASFAHVCDSIIDGLIETYKLEIDRVQGKRDTVRDAAIAARIEAAKHRPTLSELYEAYKASKMIKGKWGPKTERKYDDMQDEVLHYIGNRELTEYTTADAEGLIRSLQSKGNQASTITGKLEFVSSMFKHALKTPESIDRWKVRGNPFTEMQVQGHTEAERRFPYTDDDLRSLVTGLLKLRKLVEPHRFWVPLVALYTGARQNEVCQLLCSDIETENGILVFRFRHNPTMKQTTKARVSRTCPVHPMLRTLGFVAFVEQQRAAGQDRVFPTLTYSDAKGWTGKVRGWWNETYQKKHVEDTAGKSFHSLRKNFVDWFKQNKMYDTASDRAVVQSMVGHDDDDVTGEYYEQTFPAKTQMNMLKKLNFGFPTDLIEALAKKVY